MVRTTGTPEQRGMTVKRNMVGEIMYVVDKDGHMFFNKDLIAGLKSRRAKLIRQHHGNWPTDYY